MPPTQLCNVSSGMLLSHLEFSASPSIAQPKENTWNPQNMATSGLETNDNYSLDMIIRVGDTEDFGGSHEILC